MRNIYSFLLVLALITPFAKCDFEDIISRCHSISTDPHNRGSSYRKSSVEGGAFLYIRGSYFSTRSPDSNQVKLGLHTDCPVIEYLTTPSQVVCEIPPVTPAQSLFVDVFVDNKRLAQCGEELEFSWGATPTVQYVVPSGASVGEQIEFRGVQRVGDIREIDEIKIGGMHCRFDEIYENTEVSWYAHNTKEIECKVPHLEAGYYKVS
mmetsp:Transcript_27797/g.24406  ORF Transcript_27797/g.24406 Transcript_27797/m.24406 type:complete len:207 (+) Transcript_27797:96-716(+)